MTYHLQLNSAHLFVATRVAIQAEPPVFAERRTLAIQEFKYALLESWQQTPAIARVFLVPHFELISTYLPAVLERLM
jgi:hypothetical protein